VALLLRVLGTLLLVGGVLIVAGGVRRLPDAEPMGTPAQIVHIVDYQDEPPRATFLHVLDGSLLPYGSVRIAEVGEPDGDEAFVLIPLVDQDHPLKREMERLADAVHDGDDGALQRWSAYIEAPPDWSQVQLLMLTTDVYNWSRESAISVETHAIEGVAHPADEVLSPTVLALLHEQTAGFAPEATAVLYIEEVPPELQAMRLTIGLGGIAALMGLSTFIATFWARRPAWLH